MSTSSTSNNPPEKARARAAHAAVLAAALLLALAAGRARNASLDLKVDPGPAVPAEAETAAPLEVLGDGAIELVRGFYSRETPEHGPSFRWMARRGVIRLGHREPTMTLTLTGWLPSENPAPTTIEIEIAQKTVARFQPPAGRFTRSITLTGLAPRPGGHRVFIQVSSTVTTPPPHPRELGLCIESITWTSGSAGDAG